MKKFACVAGHKSFIHPTKKRKGWCRDRNFVAPQNDKEAQNTKEMLLIEAENFENEETLMDFASTH